MVVTNGLPVSCETTGITLMVAAQPLLSATTVGMAIGRSTVHVNSVTDSFDPLTFLTEKICKAGI